MCNCVCVICIIIHVRDSLPARGQQRFDGSLPGICVYINVYMYMRMFVRECSYRLWQETWFWLLSDTCIKHSNTQTYMHASLCQKVGTHACVFFAVEQIVSIHCILDSVYVLKASDISKHMCIWYLYTGLLYNVHVFENC
jgi:hypothetical protein